MLGVTPQNITGLVGRLIDRGLIERRPHERHPQVLEIHLTPEGRSRLDAADAAVAGLEDQVRSLLGTQRADGLRALLDRLAEPDALTPDAEMRRVD